MYTYSELRHFDAFRLLKMLMEIISTDFSWVYTTNQILYPLKYQTMRSKSSGGYVHFRGCDAGQQG